MSKWDLREDEKISYHLRRGGGGYSCLKPKTTCLGQQISRILWSKCLRVTK